MYKLYSMQRSGNSYKVRLALALLNAPYRAIEIDILRGESRTPEFLAKNPSGQVPLLEVAEGRYLAESNAILWYVCGGTPLAPELRIERAETLQWMFFEQHALEPNIGAAYFWLALVQRRPRPSDACAGRLDGAWLRRVAGDGKSPQDPRVFCRRPAHGRRYRACTATPMSPTAATTIWQPSRRSARGCAGSSRPRASSPWTGGRMPKSRIRRASPPTPDDIAKYRAKQRA